MRLGKLFGRGASHDDASIRQLLEGAGATPPEAQELVELLGRRLKPDEMHAWLSHPERSHPVPDPDTARRAEAAGLVPVVYWTPINAVSSGRTQLVVDEAQRFVGG